MGQILLVQRLAKIYCYGSTTAVASLTESTEATARPITLCTHACNTQTLCQLYIYI